LGFGRTGVWEDWGLGGLGFGGTGVDGRTGVVGRTGVDGRTGVVGRTEKWDWFFTRLRDT
jgi:hypothetical protein